MEGIAVDIFRNELFQAVTMSEAINEVQYTPQALGALGLFDEEGIFTLSVAMFRNQQGAVKLVPYSERGSPPNLTRRGDSRAILLPTFRLAERDRIHSYELLNLLREPGVAALENFAAEVARRQQVILDEFELTREHARLGAITGRLLDADGSEVINYYTEFNFVEPAEIALNIAAIPDGRLRETLDREIYTPMLLSLNGRGGAGFRVGVLCGDEFYWDIARHADIQRRLVLQAAVGGNTAPMEQMLTYDAIDYGPFRFMHYRGTDDGSTIALDPDRARFFPMGIRGAFRTYYAPGESIEDLGTRGRPLYSWLEPDPSARGEFTDVHVRSYPLYATTIPQALFRARRGA